MHLQTVVQDKVFLKTIMDSEFAFPYEGISASQLALSLMPNLKSTDPVLRDDLSYSILARILTEGLLSSTEVEELLDIAISDDYLFSGIGEIESDPVFSRTFAMLVIAAVLDSDAENKQLSPERIHNTASVVLDYAKREQDHRGFVDGKGWAHAVAHTADALDSCAHHPVLTVEERTAILDTIAKLVVQSGPLTHNEDDRLAFPVYRIIQAEQITYDYLCNWIHRFDLYSTLSQESMVRLVNVQHFLRSLYFLVCWEQENHPILQDISRQLKKLNIYYRYGVLPMNTAQGDSGVPGLTELHPEL